MIFDRGIERESSKKRDMDLLAYRLLLDQRRESKVSYRRERINELGGTGMKVPCDVWWIGGTALVNGVDFFPSDKER